MQVPHDEWHHSLHGQACPMQTKSDYAKNLHNDYANNLHNDYAKNLHNDYANNLHNDYANNLHNDYYWTEYLSQNRCHIHPIPRVAWRNGFVMCNGPRLRLRPGRHRDSRV